MANYFTDRSVEFPGRYRLTASSDPDVYDLTREEGTIYATGTPLNADYLNGAFDDTLNTVSAYYVAKALPMYDLDTTAPTGTTDGDLYAAITALNWQSEVIV